MNDPEAERDYFISEGVLATFSSQQFDSSIAFIHQVDHSIEDILERQASMNERFSNKKDDEELVRYL